MKKSKFLKLICSLCLLLCAPFVLCACSNSDPGDLPAAEGGSSGGGSSDYEIGDDGKIDSGDGEEIKIADFSDYFKGYTVLTNGDGTNYMVDTGNGEMSFNDLLDQQFSVLAQDILRRISFIYGQGTRVSNMGYVLMLPDSSNGTLTSTMYANGSNLAVVHYNSAITKLSTEVNSSSLLREINISSAEDFQKSILIIPESESDKSKNYLNYSVGALNLEGAIEGQNMKVETTDDGLGNVTATLVQDTSKMWNWTGSPATYDVLATDIHIQSFKMALAQIAASEETINGTYNSENYSKLLSNISELGLKNSYKEKIAEFIYDTIIGETLVTNDITFGEYFTNNYSGMINSTSITAIKNDVTFNENTNPRLYKGYTTVIPAIVDQAFSNTFENTSTSIYPYFMRVNGLLGTFETIGEGEDGNQELSTTGPIDLNTIILMPQNGAITEEVVAQVRVARKKDVNANIPSGISIENTEYFEHDIVVDIEINLSYKRGETLINLSKVVPYQEEDSVLSVDAKGDNSEVPKADDPLNSTESMGNGPFAYSLPLEDYFKDLGLGEMPTFQEYNGYNPLIDKNFLWDNYFKYDSESDMLYLDAGSDYLQINFNILSVKQYQGDNNSNLVEYTGGGVVFDISVQPYNK